MFTINLEDGREAPSKARKKGAKRLEFLVIYKMFVTNTRLIKNSIPQFHTYLLWGQNRTELPCRRMGSLSTFINKCTLPGHCELKQFLNI